MCGSLFIFTVKHLTLLQKACTKCGIDKEAVKWYNKKALSKRGWKRVKEKEVEKTSRKALDKRGTLWYNNKVAEKKPNEN